MAVPSPELSITYVPIDELRPYPNNPRIHTPRQIRQIATSIRSFGFANPILIGDDNGILAGHGRYEAAKLLGLEAVPTVQLSNMSPAQKRAFIIADNRLAELSGFSKELLANEIEYLLEVDFEVETIGFDSLEIDTLLRSGDEISEGEELELPALDQAPVSRPGDLWRTGEHAILCGDAREIDSYETLLSSERAEMVFTDPPYNVNIAGHVSGLGSLTHREFAMASGEMTPSEFSQSFLRTIFRRLAMFSAPGAIVFACMDWRHIRELLDAADGVFAELKNVITWAKTNAGMGSFYRSQHELIFAFKASRGQHINNFELGGKGRHRSNLWTYAGVNTFRRGRMADLTLHPTTKPLKLVSDAILDCSNPKGIILDAFLGSGTTVVAAAQTGRRGYGIEIDPLYVDVAVQRLQSAINEPARLPTGETFTEVRKSRLQSYEN